MIMFQVVALILVRKLMSKMFSKEELEILDDRLPEFVKRKRADEKKKKEKVVCCLLLTQHKLFQGHTIN